MYKLPSILLLVLITSAAIAQEKPQKEYKLMPLPPGLPGAYQQPNKIDKERLTNLLSISSTVRILAPDNMPCVVPNQANIAVIPNAFSPTKGLPYMPNSMPKHKKTPSR